MSPRARIHEFETSNLDRHRAKSARIADWSPAAIRLVSVLSEELSRAAAHSGDAVTPPPRMQTVAIGDFPYTRFSQDRSTAPDEVAIPLSITWL